MQIEINTPADAGFALIVAHRESGIGLSKKASQFCGQLVVSDDKLTDAQAHWLDQLCIKAGFPAQFSRGE